MNILIHELKMYKKSTITWIISLSILVMFFGVMFPAFKGSAEMMQSILKNFPEALQKALGISVLDLSKPLGFFGFMFMYITVIGATQAMNLGLSVLSVELREKTADFLMTKPVKRIKILNAKFMAALINLLVTNVVFFVIGKITLDNISESSYSIATFLLFCLSLFLIQVFFISFGMFLSVFLNKLKTVLPLSLSVVFGFFIVNLLNESLTGSPLAALTPFAYFSSRDIYVNQSLDYTWLTLSIVLSCIFVTITYIRYIKKDIPSV